MVFQRHLERDTKLSVKQIKQEETIFKKKNNNNNG